MRRNLLVKWRTYQNQFKLNYLKNWSIFPNFLLNLHKILNILKKEINLIAEILPKLEIAENVIT